MPQPQERERWSEETGREYYDGMQLPGDELPPIPRRVFIKRDEPFLELLRVNGVEKMFSDGEYFTIPDKTNAPDSKL
ncbi:hypothetical protein BV898_01880 [Hypsibius exemplaris]|uniref:Uncharacterized protein n=1 Tax=Hypsibius exemplaris TaxID=2072580 RepID=A0A1W0XAJ5_HYPEX|nr:hypothetical protein BV898_01880 [Hypsibius exemplaris]